MSTKKDLAQIILTLLNANKATSLSEIAQAAGLSPESAAERRTIQRALANLIESKKIEVEGQARARVYRLISDVNHDEKMSISKESMALRIYLSQPVDKRKPAPYNPDFLKSYQPNKTHYLDTQLKKKLHEIGKAEPVMRPAGTYARTIFNRLLIDLSWNSSRLEGNTYSLLETQRLIEKNEIAPGKDATETQMILNHKNAIEYIMDSVDEPKITAHEIRSIHALLSENLLPNPAACGRIRQIAVAVSGTTYLPLGNPHLLQEYFDLIVEKINLIDDPFEQSFFALTHLSYLQSFEDVNKRTSRLTANIPLIKHNLKPLSFIDVSQENYVTALLGVYEKNDVCLLRDFYEHAYYQSAERYSEEQQKTMSEPNLFRLRHRDAIQSIIQTIILENAKEKNPTLHVKELIAKLALPKSESDTLFQIIEIELLGLHEGNIVRYKILPNEFEAWSRR
ncbi:MAG: hypothetical protein A3E82_02335 [Gammaproteobacteria bacterium RIFCSPHIGHO2_12_FULL_38_11]|nr:MAG: hypothetical protein A3E82_02335 [Gammaproteobacteria bacterium RIFCSPHIGHO2_12_FULL_38_11]